LGVRVRIAQDTMDWWKQEWEKIGTGMDKEPKLTVTVK
jgi:hypothetical protein